MKNMKSTSCRDVRSKSFLCNADPSSRIDRWPVRITWRRRSDQASLVKGSAIIVQPSTQRILPLSSFTSCLMRGMSIDVLLSPHCEAGLVYLLTASYNDFESVMQMKRIKLLLGAILGLKVVVLSFRKSKCDTNEQIQVLAQGLASLNLMCSPFGASGGSSSTMQRRHFEGIENLEAPGRRRSQSRRPGYRACSAARNPHGFPMISLESLLFPQIYRIAMWTFQFASAPDNLHLGKMASWSTVEQIISGQCDYTFDIGLALLIGDGV